MPQGAPHLVAALTGLALVGCTYTLNEGDCAKYRDRLETWASAKAAREGRKVGPHDSARDQELRNSFMKSCAGTTVSQGAYRCLGRAADEAAFFKCLD